MEMVGSVAEGASEKKMHALIPAHHVCLAAAARSSWCSLPVRTANTIGTLSCSSDPADCGKGSSALARLSTFLLERDLP
eukprot:scaffold42691_cov68-Phaeocystis_antarctica.AAC.3